MLYITKNAKAMEYIIYILLSTSLILLILSIGQVSIYQYPPDAFYYFKRLPIIYWIGLSLSVSSVLLLLMNNKSSSIEILPIILIASYIYGVPNLIHEYARYMDIYDHGTDLVSLVNNGYIDPSIDYLNNYPSIFILSSVLFNILNIDVEYPFVFFKLFNIFTQIFIVVLIYILARSMMPSNNNIAIIAPFAFMALNWTPTGQFVPHTHSLILYFIFFISLIHVLNNNKRWTWMIVSIMMLIIINITSPTNATALLVNISFITIISLLLSFKLYKNTLFKRLSILTVLTFIIWLNWLSYNGEDIGLGYAKRYANNFIEGLRDINILLPPSPNEPFSIANRFRIAETALVTISIIISSLLLLKRRILDSNILVMLGLAGIVIFVPLVMFASDVLLTRSHLYLTIPFSLLITYIIYKGVIKNSIKFVFIIIISGCLYITHITLYASEPQTYLHSSLIYVEKSLNSHILDIQATMYAYSVGGFGARYYDMTDNKPNLDVTYYADSYSKYYPDLESNIKNISSEFIKDRINFILFSRVDQNRISVQYNDYEFYNILKDDLNSKRFNLLFNTSTSQIYYRSR